MSDSSDSIASSNSPVASDSIPSSTVPDSSTSIAASDSIPSPDSVPLSDAIAPTPIALDAAAIPPRLRPSIYPATLAARVAGREKRSLGDPFGLTQFGVNLTRLAPQAMSALRHAHARQDEFIYILQGHPTLQTDEGRTPLAPGMCAGFKAGTGNGHHLINETDEDVIYLEIGDRTAGDEVIYPDDDLQARLVDGEWQIFHKDGTPYG